MRLFDDTLLLSASDLTKFIGCSHATTLDLAYLRGGGPEPSADTEDAELLQKYGFEHEEKYLEKLKAAGRNILSLDSSNLAAASIATRDAMRAGVDVIYQGALLQDGWGGWADFIERVETPSDLGAYSYEVVDTKLKRSVHPTHVLQLSLYSELISAIQGRRPVYAHVELGNGERETLRLTEYAAYAQHTRQRLANFVADPQPTRPVPCSDCALCRWSEHCTDIWTKEDSLTNVANITRGQIKKLEASGVKTLEALARHAGPVRGMLEPTFLKLKTQARLQQERKTGEPSFELRPLQEGKGFALLPEPQEGDLFYDIEGDPYYPDGLEYLHGIWYDGKFKAFWAHDHDAEKQALIDLLDFFKQRLQAYPSARIYHYAPYEITALKRLTAKYGVGEGFRDQLLREKRFVDLYAVVRSGLICSEQNYSIKSMEAFYDIERTGEVKTAGGSVIAYERWREIPEQDILDEIEDYNRIDCISTEKLRDWLIRIRPDMPWPALDHDASEKAEAEDSEVEELRRFLAASDLSSDRQNTLFNLGRFHAREAKPAWWAIFESLGKDDEDLLDDLNALAGVTAVGDAYSVGQSQERLYKFPDQETKLRSGDTVSIPTEEGFGTLKLSKLDQTSHQAWLRVGNARAHLLKEHLTLHPNAPLNTKVLEAAIADVIADQCTGRSYRAVDDLLNRTPPRLTTGPAEFASHAEPVSTAITAVHAMDETVLPIQGPPGTGKTYVTARAILSLIEAGYRVGVTSNSHEAIRNVLLGCERAIQEDGLTFPVDLIHKVSGTGGYPDDSAVRTTTKNDVAATGEQIVGGTAFFFARDENIQAFDWLFVDEAGQVGLANMVGIGRAARNIVLVGDPQQLPQVIQGAHPEPANLSCLEWVLGPHSTIPNDRGIFLSTTRRMHPDINQYISEQFYEGRLNAHPTTQHQAVLGTPWAQTGVHWVPVEHEGNTQVAKEEVEAINSCCKELLMGQWRDKDGRVRNLQYSDIIVVAPYNAQVNALRAALPEEIRVGTVDKFQGQEAPICLISMAASSAEESPRGMEFLFSPNRINVAVSRAKALALVFGASRLCEAKCQNVNHIRMVNSICVLES